MTKIEIHNEWKEWRVKLQKTMTLIDFHIGRYKPHQKDWTGDWHIELALLGFRVLIRKYDRS